MASTSSNSRLLAIGAAVLVVGVILVLVIIRSGDDTPSDPAAQAADDPTAVATESETDTPLTPEQLSTARMALPLEVPDGMEAFATTVNFVRGVAGVPTAGDHVKLYRLPQAVIVELDAEGQLVPQPPVPGSGLPPIPPAAEVVIADAEVLGVTGSVPSANGGTITLVLSVTPETVPTLMALSNEADLPEGTEVGEELISDHTNELWFTLLPEVEDEAPSDEASSEEDAA